MGIITGYICLICFVLLAGKYITRKTNCKKLNSIFHNIHKPVSCIFLLVCITHLLLVLPVWQTRNLLVNLSGIIGFGIVILIIILCHLLKKEKYGMHCHRILTVFLLITIVFHIVIYYIDFNQYKTNINHLKIENTDISKIPDGNYIGEYDAGYIYAKVKVSVKEKKITKIEILKHQNERGQKAEKIINDMQQQQKINVDAISSATCSSLCIEKACENALKIKPTTK